MGDRESRAALPKDPDARRLWRNTDQLGRIRYRAAPYSKMLLRMWRRGVSIPRLIESRFPYRYPEPARPASLNVELTDACDVECRYCNNPLFPKPRTFMTMTTAQAIARSLMTFSIDRVVVGGGEPTLNPWFAEISRMLREPTRFLSIVTNGQWKRAGIVDALLDSYDMVEVSVDAGGREMYEHSRVGASYDLLIANLEQLRRRRGERGLKTLINLRLMIRPSTESCYRSEREFWRRWADTIMKQYVEKLPESDYADDVYLSVEEATASFSRCTLPFKNLQVRANGNVPVCAVLGSLIPPRTRRFMGNVNETPLADLWVRDEIRRIRTAHRRRDTDRMPECQGCGGR